MIAHKRFLLHLARQLAGMEAHVHAGEPELRVTASQFRAAIRDAQENRCDLRRHVDVVVHSSNVAVNSAADH